MTFQMDAKQASMIYPILYARNVGRPPTDEIREALERQEAPLEVRRELPNTLAAMDVLLADMRRFLVIEFSFEAVEEVEDIVKDLVNGGFSP